MTEYEFAVGTAAQMRELGRRLASVLRAGDLVILTGGLGAGKTTLTQGIGEGLGVRGPVTSPTFVIARVHPPAGTAVAGTAVAGTAGAGGSARPALVHADAYRLGSVLELDDLDLDTDLASAVTVVEWGEGLAEGLSADRLEITIAVAAPDAAGAAGGDGDDEDGDDEDSDGGDGAGDADLPRTMLLAGVGRRWEGVNLPLVGLADRL